MVVSAGAAVDAGRGAARHLGLGGRRPQRLTKRGGPPGCTPAVRNRLCNLPHTAEDACPNTRALQLPPRQTHTGSPFSPPGPPFICAMPALCGGRGLCLCALLCPFLKTARPPKHKTGRAAPTEFPWARHAPLKRHVKPKKLRRKKGRLTLFVCLSV